MSEKKDHNRKECLSRCEREFLECQKRTYTGCVEVIRECRERCPGS
ncbi:MAG: hypothetical protein LJE65_03070 [Desulfobacteraceae bacterium]|jgi:hypothetical protein|nr:hypothetical protein [Desulfobacteraceae bacterium]